MVKTKIKNLLTSIDVLQYISEQQLPIRTSYNIAKLIQSINEELRTYDSSKLSLCKKYGTLNEDGGSYKIHDAESFNKEHDELLNYDVEFNCDKLVFPDDFELTPQQIIAIFDFMKVGDSDDS